MTQLICHLIGDYVLQNHAMALKKTTSSAYAALHVFFYAIPFLLLTRSPIALLIITSTHFLIDRFRLAKYWVEFWGIGCNGPVCRRMLPPGESLPEAPPFLAVWLLIIVDNTLHLTINALALSVAA